MVLLLAATVRSICVPPIRPSGLPLGLRPVCINIASLLLSLAESISAAGTVKTSCGADATPRGLSSHRNDTDTLSQRPDIKNIVIGSRVSVYLLL